VFNRENTVTIFFLEIPRTVVGMGFKHVHVHCSVVFKASDELFEHENNIMMYVVLVLGQFSYNL